MPATIESEVRSYCRSWPTTFAHARGSRLVDEDGHEYLDFFSGAGALNYGHNPPELKRELISYLERDGVAHSLDMATVAKQELLRTFQQLILEPRGLDYKVQFAGPTGTNSVEAALKLARLVTGRQGIVAFTGAFHGVSVGSLAATANGYMRSAAGVPLHHTLRLPYDSWGSVSGLDLLAGLLDDTSSGVSLPAAVIVETVQGEGGIRCASTEWLLRLQSICARHDILLIVDDVQMGCGRTGPFFSFETSGIVPDIVCLSKSISGYGLPMALTLMRPRLDRWGPGQHNGTFRGLNPAFVTATAALRTFWSDDKLEKSTALAGDLVAERLEALRSVNASLQLRVRGRGLVWGLVFQEPAHAAHVARAAFDRRLLVERSGSQDEVVKLMPPLTITRADLAEGLRRLAEAVATVQEQVTSQPEMVTSGLPQ